jgi:hypothetical protein
MRERGGEEEQEAKEAKEAQVPSLKINAVDFFEYGFGRVTSNRLPGDLTIHRLTSLPPTGPFVNAIVGVNCSSHQLLLSPSKAESEEGQSCISTQLFHHLVQLKMRQRMES